VPAGGTRSGARSFLQRDSEQYSSVQNRLHQFHPKLRKSVKNRFKFKFQIFERLKLILIVKPIGITDKPVDIIGKKINKPIQIQI
jgi:hypothetical protein